MEQPSASCSFDQSLQRLAAKSTYAAELLKHAVKNAENVHQLHTKVGRYVQQAKLVLTWKRGCGAMKMLGSTSKMVGGALVVAAPLYPKLRLAVKVGHKLWKFGAGLKLLTAIGNVLRDLWQTGCRRSLMDFVEASVLLTQNLGVFGEVVRDLQKCAQPVCAHNAVHTSEHMLNLLRPFVSSEQIEYVKHVLNIIFCSTSYSPLFDFILTSSNLTATSSTAQLMQEIESFRFTEFVEQGTSQSLVVIGSFLHVSRELLDFLDGFQKVTENDCRFLYECLTKFTQESTNILQAASTLTHLGQGRGGQFSSTSSTNLLDHRFTPGSVECLLNLALAGRRYRQTM